MKKASPIKMTSSSQAGKDRWSWTHSWSQFVCCIVMSLILTGCAQMQINKPLPNFQSTEKSVNSILDVVETEHQPQIVSDQAIKSQPSPSLQALIEEAKTASPLRRQALLLKATHSSLEQEQTELAGRIFSLVQKELLGEVGDLDYLYHLIGLELAVAQKDLALTTEYYGSLEAIANQRQIPLSTHHYLTDASIRAKALALQGQHLAAARLIVFRLEDLNHLPDEEALMWQDLAWDYMSLYRDNKAEEQEILALQTTQVPSEEWQAWLELSDIFETFDRHQLALVNGRLQSWKSTWLQTRIAQLPPTDVQELMLADFKILSHVAVLLPSTGKLRHAGKAITDGIMASYYGEQGDTTASLKLTFMDTGGEASIVSLYEQARLQGAEFIVGPLDKSKVQELKRHQAIIPRENRLPTLALNYSADQLPIARDFFEFGLRAEDEAIEVARYALESPYHRALILRPDSDWGMRVSDAFKAAFTEQNGIILDEAAFTEPQKFSDEVQRLLGLEISRSRHKQMEQKLGKKLEFVPRRRQDVDFIFMIASPNEARQLKPTINYHYGENIPVLAISHSYSGANAPQFDKDLDGVLFVDIPWILEKDLELRQKVQEHLNANTQFKRLHALGIDAFRLMREFPVLRHLSSSEVDGVTGRLHLNSNGQIYRELSWAKFSRGIVEPLHSTVDQFQ